MILFGVEVAVAEITGLLSQFGSAGLAVLAVYWLTTKHEKQLDKRDALDAKLIDVLDKLADNVEAQTRRLDTLEHLTKRGTNSDAGK